MYGAGDEVTQLEYVRYNNKPFGPSNLPWENLKVSGTSAFSVPSSGLPAYYMFECRSVYSSTHFGMQNGSFTAEANMRDNLALGFTRNTEWQSGSMLLYNQNDGKPEVTKGSVDQLRGADNYGTDKCSIIFACQHEGGARQYIVYNFDSNRAQQAINP